MYNSVVGAKTTKKKKEDGSDVISLIKWSTPSSEECGAKKKKKYIYILRQIFFLERKL